MSTQIEDTEAWDRNKKYIAYKISVNLEGQEWFIFRRYNEFCSLYEKLKKHFPEYGLKIPGKRLFGNMDSSFIKKRKEGLHGFLQDVISNPKMMELSDVKTFLGVDVQLFDSKDGSEGMDTDAVEGHRTHAIRIPTYKKAGNEMNLGTTENKKARPSDFEFLKVIGRGSFGKVYLARHKTDMSIFAIKVLSKEQIKRRNEVKHIMSERNVLVKNVRHPFLCSLHYSFQTPEKLYFVLDYINGGELFFHLQKERCFAEPRAKFYAAEMASALGYLHSLRIIYRDLKPENILLDPEGHISLTDFGLCKEDITSTTSTFCGTPEYLAPEVLRKQPYDYAVDWWCLGSVLYEMLYGLPPFYSRVTNEMYDNILYKPLRLKPNASLPAQSLLTGLLQKDKNRRLGSKHDFDDISRHEFFFTIDWAQLNAKAIPPPFKPNVRSLTDTRNIDPEFTRETVSQSVGKSFDSSRLSASVMEADESFIGFSYVPPSEELEEEY